MTGSGRNPAEDQKQALQDFVIRQALLKKDVEPLVKLLKSDDWISSWTRDLIADLFDPRGKNSLRVELKVPRGRPAETERNVDLFWAVQEWYSRNDNRGMPDEVWAAFGQQCEPKIDAATTKKAYERGRNAVELNQSLQRE